MQFFWFRYFSEKSLSVAHYSWAGVLRPSPFVRSRVFFVFAIPPSLAIFHHPRRHQNGYSSAFLQVHPWMVDKIHAAPLPSLLTKGLHWVGVTSCLCLASALSVWGPIQMNKKSCQNPAQNPEMNPSENPGESTKKKEPFQLPEPFLVNWIRMAEKVRERTLFLSNLARIWGRTLGSIEC